MNIPQNPFKSSFNKILEIVKQIKLNNKKIGKFFDSLLKLKEECVEYNDMLIKRIEAFKILST